MKKIEKILCVCIGNGDRSPVMAAILSMFLKNASQDISCESVGVGENAAKGGPAAKFAVAAAKRIGIDLSGHQRRRVNQVDLPSYDLVICASDEIAAQVMQEGAEMGKVYNAQIANPWPCHFQADYDETFDQILVAMNRVITRYFNN